MSCDFAVWLPARRLSNHEAGALYSRLCDGDTTGLQDTPAIDAFYEELVSMHPEIDDIPESRLGDHDLCPWSCAFDHSPGHLIMCCVWPKADDVHGLLLSLADRHGLALYDPQSEVIHYPGEASSDERLCEKPAEEASALPRWAQIAVGSAFALFLLPCTAGAVMMVFVPNEKAPISAPIGGAVMTMMALWLFGLCFRLVTGRRAAGGLMGPRMLRLSSWMFLLLPVGGLFTGYFVTDTALAVLKTAIYVNIFFGLQSLARRRERRVKGT